MLFKCLECSGCGWGPECTRAEYKTISLDPQQYLMQTMRARLATKEDKKKNGRRKSIVDPVFGDMKYNQNIGL